MRLVTPVLLVAVCKSSRIRRKPNSGTVRRFSPLKPAFFFPNSAKAEFVGFGSRFLESHGFLGAKAGFLLLSARGWRTSRGIFCVVFFLFFPGVWGLLGSQGEPGFYFFYRDFMERQLFWGKFGRLLSAFSFAPPPYFLFLYFLCTLCFFFAIILGSGGFYGRDS